MKKMNIRKLKKNTEYIICPRYKGIFIGTVRNKYRTSIRLHDEFDDSMEFNIILPLTLVSRLHPSDNYREGDQVLLYADNIISAEKVEFNGYF